MTIFHCAACRRPYVTQPPVCRCGAQEFSPAEHTGQGRVYSCTTLRAAAERFEKDLPFQIAIIELDGGARLTARITGPSVDIDDEVNFVEERDGVHFFASRGTDAAARH